MTAQLNTIITNLMTYVANPANLPAGEVNWWATSSEMGVAKDTDFQYPYRK
jgi:hypothetical protein